MAPASHSLSPREGGEPPTGPPGARTHQTPEGPPRRPDASGSGAGARILFRLQKDEYGYPPEEWEVLCAAPAGTGLYEIASIPVFVRSVSLGDLVSATTDGKTLRFDAVWRRSGHSTLRIIVFDDAEVPKTCEQMRQLGCSCEVSDIPGLVTVDVAPSVDFARVTELLEAGAREGRWDYERGHVAGERQV